MTVSPSWLKTDSSMGIVDPCPLLSVIFASLIQTVSGKGGCEVCPPTNRPGKPKWCLSVLNYASDSGIVGGDLWGYLRIA